MFTSMRESKYVLKVNLLGVFNFGSVTDLIKNGRLVVDRDTGTISVLDKVTATRVGFTSAECGQRNRHRRIEFGKKYNSRALRSFRVFARHSRR
jgi:hypothetical protein